MALFGGSPKGFDTAALQRMIDAAAQTKAGVVRGAFERLPALNKQFGLDRAALGRAFETGENQRAQQFAQGLQQIESPEFVGQQQAKARELAFRDLPAAQQAIRENLAATGGLNRGAAITALQQPVLQASRAASDTGFQIQQEANQRNIARKQLAIETIFSTGQGAALERLGIDRDTANTLFKLGRSDLIDKAMAIAGIEEGRSQGLLDVEMLRQQQGIAKDQARRQQTAQLLSTAGMLGGAALGGFAGPGAGFNPLGGLIGSQLGGSIGGFAGGGGGAGQAPDLSSLLTLLAFKGQGAKK